MGWFLVMCVYTRALRRAVLSCGLQAGSVWVFICVVLAKHPQSWWSNGVWEPLVAPVSWELPRETGYERTRPLGRWKKYGHLRVFLLGLVTPCLGRDGLFLCPHLPESRWASRSVEHQKDLELCKTHASRCWVVVLTMAEHEVQHGPRSRAEDSYSTATPSLLLDCRPCTLRCLHKC